jgi:hypothetical protein
LLSPLRRRHPYEEPAAAISRAEDLECNTTSAELRLDLDRHARVGDRP